MPGPAAAVTMATRPNRSFLSFTVSIIRAMPRAAVCTALGKPLEVMDLRLDGPRAGEISVRLGASGVCGSALSVLKGHLPSPLPAVLGHDGAGTVPAGGEGATTVG